MRFLKPVSVTALAACIACSDPPPRPEHPNILLVVVDTLRADRLGCYGNERGLTPEIDRLAEGGQRFEAAFAHAPWTLPSMASLLTSTYPQQHGAGGSLARRDPAGTRVGGFTGLADGVETLAEAFGARGYQTASFVGVDFLDHAFGLTRGFQHVDAQAFGSNVRVRPAGATTDAVLDWLSGRPEDSAQPFLMLVHYFDAHAVYDPPEAYRRRFAAPEDQRESWFRFGTRQQMLELREGTLPLHPETIARAEKLYDGEVAHVDAEVGRLLRTLEERGLARDTLVVFTSDHGEEFLDHGGFEHGHSLYRELTHVPLIVSWPGEVKAGVVSTTVGLVDVAPTLCQLADVPSSEHFHGRSLAPWFDGSEAEPQKSRAHLAHGNFWGAPLASWIEGDWKLILEPVPGRDEITRLYRWREDAREEHDVSAEHPEVVERLRKALRGAEAALRKARGGEVELSAEERARLEALGY